MQLQKKILNKSQKKTTYDSGYGKSEVAEDLVIVGDGWWLERNEYDGAEWWEYKETPKQINEVKEVKRLAGGIDTGDTLAELNKGK